MILKPAADLFLLKKLPALLVLLFVSNSIFSQPKTDTWLQNLFYSNASPLLRHVLNNPDSFQYQIIYTRIDRDKHNRPHLTNYYLQVDSSRYFNPASTVKLPTVLAALEKLNELKKHGIDKNTTMLTDSSYKGQSAVKYDSTAPNNLPSIGHYIKKIFLVSDNDAYNRLYEFTGQQYLNDFLWNKGYSNARITRRFVPMSEDENRHTNKIDFVKNDKIIYTQPAANNTRPFNFLEKILIGKAHYNWSDELINQPFDFTTHNKLTLADLQRLVQSVVFPATLPKYMRPHLSENDRKFVLKYMSELPSESMHPRYDSAEFFDSYTKFFMFKANRQKPPAYIRMFNKPGWSYGFLTDAAYIVDFKNKVEFMLSATIYVNRDGVLNDNKYEYDEIGYPFFKETGNIIYQYELKRPRATKPNLKEFVFSYD